MKNWIKSTITTTFFFFCFAGAFIITASAGEYHSLKNIKSVDTIFDFRDGKPGSAVIHLKLVHDTFKDQAIRAVSEKPKFAVVFMASSVLLLSNERYKFSDSERKKLAEFDEIISAMAKDGIRLEVCMFAANLFKVDPETIAPEIHRVNNGWISSLGYQEKGYSLIPAY